MTASLLILTLLVGWPSAFLQSGGFSHRLHLESVGLECIDCHEAALSSLRTEDRLYPDPEACRRCHLEEDRELCRGCEAALERLESLDQPFPGMIFSHRRHLESDGFRQQPDGIAPEILAEGESGEHECLSCHQGMDQVTVGGRENFPTMVKCLSCHQGDGDAMGACHTCHVDEFNLRPASHHSDTFFDDHSGDEISSRKEECRICHTPGFNPCTQCH